MDILILHTPSFYYNSILFEIQILFLMIKTRDDNNCIFLGYLKFNQLKFTNGVNLHSLSTD